MELTWKNINAGQLRSLIQLGGEATDEDLIRICLGKSKRDMTVEELEDITLGELIPPATPSLPLFFTFEGQLYGKLKPEEMTFGEYIDFMEFGKSPAENLLECMALVFRPVKLNAINRVKLWAALKLFEVNTPKSIETAVKLQDTIAYKIEKYNAGNCLMRSAKFETLPSYLAQWTLSFFFLTSQVLLNGSLSSFLEKLGKKIKAPLIKG
jgi:hypothetical protein